VVREPLVHCWWPCSQNSSLSNSWYRSLGKWLLSLAAVVVVVLKRNWWDSENCLCCLWWRRAAPWLHCKWYLVSCVVVVVGKLLLVLVEMVVIWSGWSWANLLINRLLFEVMASWCSDR
jgi:hypothetical protein